MDEGLDVLLWAELLATDHERGKTDCWYDCADRPFITGVIILRARIFVQIAPLFPVS